MNKKLIIILLIIIVTGGIVSYLHFVPPTFKIISYTPSTHSGIYKFDGISNSFSNATTGVQGGRMGWELEVKPNSDNTITFNLLKKGKFIKELARR